jgi:hypothetical protein
MPLLVHAMGAGLTADVTWFSHRHLASPTAADGQSGRTRPWPSKEIQPTWAPEIAPVSISKNPPQAVRTILLKQRSMHRSPRPSWHSFTQSGRWVTGFSRHSRQRQRFGDLAVDHQLLFHSDWSNAATTSLLDHRVVKPRSSRNARSAKSRSRSRSEPSRVRGRVSSKHKVPTQLPSSSING